MARIQLINATACCYKKAVPEGILALGPKSLRELRRKNFLLSLGYEAQKNDGTFNTRTKIRNWNS
jgi:hypothetical protein